MKANNPVMINTLKNTIIVNFCIWGCMSTKPYQCTMTSFSLFICSDMLEQFNFQLKNTKW